MLHSPRRGHDLLQIKPFLPRGYDGNSNLEDTDFESTVGAESCRPTTISDISSSSDPRQFGTGKLNVRGDVQTCVSILLVLGERTSEEMVDVAIQKLWFLGYLGELRILSVQCFYATM
ncbi:unnamed protein product [Toxocara canis]|uniref:E3 ubiquitin-protein ligase n=1 Tax=Toxocara canis TaxID=6265 RepID=A0A183V833_TOXCA|nr:unnamed protein product [Toxocara canis]